MTCEDREGLETLLESYPKLRRAWALKESFSLRYRSGGRAEAEQRLAIWERSVKEEGPAPFRKLLSMLRDWRQEILNYFDYPYTNGFVEGKNNRIKVIKRLAYGYRNRESVRQRILLSNIDGTGPKVA